MNTWPGGVRRAMTQSEHAAWNTENYPGTLQMCFLCDRPTGKCEDDALYSESGEPMCPDCWDDTEAHEIKALP